MRIEVLGSVRASSGGSSIALGSTGERAVLGVLALACGQPLTRSELIDILWGERPPATAVNVLQTRIKRLRRALEPGRRPHAPSTVLPQVGDGYVLSIPDEGLDLLVFRQLVAAALHARGGGDLHRARDSLGRALGLWRGAPLADVPLLAHHPKVTILIEERRTALANYGEVLIATGAVTDAITVLEEAAAAQPLDEAGQARLIRAYQAAQRRAEAFTVYHRVRRQLADELGIDPGPELTAAHTELLSSIGPPSAGQPPHRRVDHDTAPPEPVSPPPARQTPQLVPAQLPADVPHFTGRTGELSRLDAAVLGTAADADTPTAVSISVISGTAGVGKTALAVHWAHRVRSRFPDGQLYVNLRGYDPEQPVTPAEALAGFLGDLDVSGRDIPPGLDERAARYRSLLSGRRMLVVLDNAASADQIRPLLPGEESCVVLVTSRDRLSGLVARHGADRVDLDLLPLDDAVGLVRSLLGDRARTERAAVVDLVRRCARLPLALRVAAERCASHPAASLADLVAELGDRQRRLSLLEAGGDPRTDVRAVLSWSYTHLPGAAARAFRLLGLYPGMSFDRRVLAALVGCDRDEARRLLDLLAVTHLVQPAGAGRFGMHDLLRAYAVELAEAEEPDAQRRDALDGLLSWYLVTAIAAVDALYPAERRRLSSVCGDGGAPPGGDLRGQVPAVEDRAGALAWLDAERQNLVAVVAHAAAHGWPDVAVQLSIVLLRYVESGGHYSAGVDIFTHALRATRLLADRDREVHLLTNIAVILAQRGQFEQAVEHLQAAMARCREASDRFGEARVSGNLGHVYRWQGRYDLAVDRFLQTAQLCREVSDTVGEARAYGNLGDVYRRQGRYTLAADRLREALSRCRSIGDMIGEAYALVSLGHVAQRQRRSQQALDCHRQALALFTEAGERSGVAHALEGLGVARLRMGQTDAAIDHILQAGRLFTELGERGNQAVADNSHAEALRLAGQLGPAGSRHASALALATEVGNRHEQARAHAGLAIIRQLVGDPAGADRHRRSALGLYHALGVPESEAEVDGHLRRVFPSASTSSSCGHVAAASREHGRLNDCIPVDAAAFDQFG